MHPHDHGARADGDRRLLGGAIVLIAALMVGELVAGILAGSLALLADAGHLVSDVAALGLALAASTSGFPVLSAHVLVAPGSVCHALRRQLEAMLAERFDLDHSTLQVEHVPGAVQLGPSFRRRSPLHG